MVAYVNTFLYQIQISDCLTACNIMTLLFRNASLNVVVIELSGSSGDVFNG